MPLKTLLSLALACLASASQALPASDPYACLPATVQGRVYEQGSPDPLPGATVSLQGLSLSTLSDAKGYYRLDIDGEFLPQPRLEIKASADGHSARTRVLALKPGQGWKLDLYLAPVDFNSGTFVVQAKKDRPQVLTSTLTKDEIKRVPGAEGDALRAVQDLPGVAMVSDISTQMVVQGGGPDDNLYLLDNIPWPFPFHFGGIISTVNSDLLDSVDLNAAGFNARWGNIMGAVLDAKTRPGKKDRIHASADLSLIMAQGMLEGPLGLGDASFTLAGRRSYLELLLRHLSSATANLTAVPYFWDLGGTLDFSLGPKNHFRALALSNDDKLGVFIKPGAHDNPHLAGQTLLDNGSFNSGISWTNTSWNDFSSTLTPYFYTVNLEDSAGSGAAFDLVVHQKIWGLKEEAIWQAPDLFGMGQELGLGAGAEIVDYSTVLFAYENFFSFNAPSGALSTTISSQTSNRFAYIQDRIKLLPAWTLDAGLRYDKSDLVARDLALPRLGLEWKLSPETSAKAAWGLYSQFPTGAQLNQNIGNPDLGANLASHSVLSLEHKFSPELSLRADTYYKQYNSLVVQVPTLQNYSGDGSGDAKGVELFLKEDMGTRFFGWISYAYSRSERLYPPAFIWSPYEYDQTNLLTIVASYSFSPAWSLGAKLHYNTGPLQRTFEGATQDSQGNWHGIFSDAYTYRLADYLRLDLRTDYTWRLRSTKLSLYAEVLNVLDRPNPEGLNFPSDYSSGPSVINNLPIFPYLGIELDY